MNKETNRNTYINSGIYQLFVLGIACLSVGWPVYSHTENLAWTCSISFVTYVFYMGADSLIFIAANLNREESEE